MALTAKQQEAFDYLSKTFPNMSTDGKAKLLGIWEGESGLKKSRTEAMPLYVNEKSAAGLFVSPFQVLDSYPTEAKIVKKYKTKAGSEQTKELLEQERSLWLSSQDREQWFKSHKERYGIPSFDPSKSHIENKKLQNQALNKLTPEQRQTFEKEFYDKVYKEQGGYYTRGIGPIQVTGMANIIKSLNTASEIYNRPEWAELAKIVQNEPEKIDSLIRNNPELETALSMGWIKNNLVTPEGDLKTGSLKEINTIVNKGNAGYNEKNQAYTSFIRDLNTPAPKTSDQQIPYPVTPEITPTRLTPQQMEQAVRSQSEPQYMSMEELLGKRGILSNPLLR